MFGPSQVPRPTCGSELGNLTSLDPIFEDWHLPTSLHACGQQRRFWPPPHPRQRSLPSSQSPLQHVWHWILVLWFFEVVVVLESKSSREMQNQEEFRRMKLTNFVIGIDVLGAEKLGAEGGLAHPRGSKKQNPEMLRCVYCIDWTFGGCWDRMRKNLTTWTGSASSSLGLSPPSMLRDQNLINTFLISAAIWNKHHFIFSHYSGFLVETSRLLFIKRKQFVQYFPDFEIDDFVYQSCI